MEFLAIMFAVIFLLFVITALTPKPGEPGGANADNRIVVKRKQCPPHQWFWQEVVDQDGIKYGERIVCKVCGPLRSSGDENES